MDRPHGSAVLSDIRSIYFVNIGTDIRSKYRITASLICMYVCMYVIQLLFFCSNSNYLKDWSSSSNSCSSSSCCASGVSQATRGWPCLCLGRCHNSCILKALSRTVLQACRGLGWSWVQQLYFDLPLMVGAVRAEQHRQGQKKGEQGHRHQLLKLSHHRGHTIKC